MKTMDEFGSVLALASLVLGVCAAVDMFLVAPDSATAKPDQTYSGVGARKSIAVARRHAIQQAGSDKAWTVAVAARPEAANSAPVAPAAQMPLQQQTQSSL